MLWLTILIATLFTVVAVGYVIWPIFSPNQRQMLAVEDDTVTQLIYRKDSVLLSIKELEFDYHMGKLSEADFTRFNHRLRQQAMGLLRQIEIVAPDATALEDELERAIAHHRQSHDQDKGGQLSPSTASPTPATQDTQTIKFCPECGTKVSSSHKFCVECGTDLRDGK